jgi:hypothetical protein
MATLVSCGSSGGYGGGDFTFPDIGAPSLTGLEIRTLDRELPNRNVRYEVRSVFRDITADLIGGQCEVLLHGNSIGHVTINPAPGTPTRATDGSVACRFFVNSPVPQQISGTLRVFDRSGKRSNELSFLIGTPGGSAPAAVQGGMQSATGQS